MQIEPPSSTGSEHSLSELDRIAAFRSPVALSRAVERPW